MNLLIITQKVDKNDPVLGFFESWLVEFSKNFKSVLVTCNEKGECELPPNVSVRAIGGSDSGKAKKFFNFLKIIFSERENYDAVFVHMTPIHVLLGGLLWKIFNKKIYLWYTHGRADLKLKLACVIAEEIFTANKEGCNIESKKIKIVSHGIDLSVFNAVKSEAYEKPPLKIVHIGRVTRIKNCDVLIRAAGILRDDYGIDSVVRFVGNSVTDQDKIFMEELKILSGKLGLADKIFFDRGVPYSEVPEIFSKAQISVNLSPLGGMDKTVLESILSGVPVFVSNSTFSDVFGEFGDVFIFEEKSEKDLASKIFSFLNGGRKDVVQELRKKIASEFSLERLIKRISSDIVRNYQ